MAPTHQYSKQLRIDANIEVVLALNAIQTYIRHKRDKEPDRPLGRFGAMAMSYSMPTEPPLVLIVTENKDSYSVRMDKKRSADQQTIID